MNGKMPKLSLSRKRRRESTSEGSSRVRPVIEGEFNQNLFACDENSSLEEHAINHRIDDPEEIEQETKSNFPKKKPEFSQSVSRALHRPCKTPNNIAAWLRKPLASRSAQCPVCDKVVLLAKINQHLDDNCSDLGLDNEVFRHDSNNCVRNENKANFTQKDLNRFKDQNRTRERETYSLTRTVKTPGSCDKPGFERTQDNESNPSRDSCKLSPRRGTSLDATVTPTLTKEGQESLPHEEKTFKSNNSDDVCVSSIFNEEVCYLKNVVEEKDKYNLGSSCTTEHILSTNERQKQSSFHINEEELAQSNSKENLEDVNNTGIEYEPYYMSNFKLVLSNVFSNEHDKSLFNEEDNKVLETFTSMSLQEQKLYIRLFQRKRGWFKCHKLEYPRISKDLRPIINHLIKKGFLDDDNHLTSLRDTLNLLAAPDLKNLVKSLHISSKSSGGTKEDIVEAIISQADNQRTIFGSYRNLVLKRAKQLLGPCVRVASDPRNVYCRVLLLFTMNVIPDEEDSTNNGQTQQLSTLYLANIGRVVYPSYLIDRPTPVFLARDSLVSFSEAYQRKHEMLVALENNNFEVAYGYYPNALKKFQEILSDIRAGSETPASLLPEHLRCFTAEWAITKMCYFGVEVLQKWRRYEDAVNQLELLLQQKVFCFDSRGRWYDRLALNLHQHLKKPDKAMEVIRQGLADHYVRFGRRLALVQRAKRILSSSGFRKKGKEKKHDQYKDLDLTEPSQPRSITITGTRCAELGVFIAPEIDHNGEVIDGTTTFCAVEQYALSYYRQQGFDQGMHGERSPFTTLYALFVWDEIFSSGIPDVFRSPFQAAPLDMCFDSFYTTRKEIIDKRLQEIKDAPVQKLQDMLTRSWTDHEGQVCAGINWEQFSTVDQAKQLVACLGGSILSGIFSRFAQGYRYHSAGFPDLVVWNSFSSDYRIAEVKGPGDKLSTKQQIWLDILQSLGANVEVCYVTAVGAKRLKVS